jgi:hypothetical protein
MRDKVLVDLDHRPPRDLLVLEARLSADTDDLRVVRRGGNETVERICLHGSIGIDDEHELRVGSGSVSVRHLTSEGDWLTS